MSHTDPCLSERGNTHAPVGAAGHAVRETQAAVNAALDSLAASVRTLGDDAAAAGNAAEATLYRGMDHLRDGSRALRDHARQGSVQAQQTIRRDPLKSVLIAAASGAAVGAVLTWLARPRIGS